MTEIGLFEYFLGESIWIDELDIEEWYVSYALLKIAFKDREWWRDECCRYTLVFGCEFGLELTTSLELETRFCFGISLSLVLRLPSNLEIELIWLVVVCVKIFVHLVAIVLVVDANTIVDNIEISEGNNSA